MKLAVISDIHGNYKALEAFLDHMEKTAPDRIICLGDYVTDGPYPDRTMELVENMTRRYPCCLIRGNREEYLIQNDHKDAGWKPSSQSGSLYYTARTLSPKYIALFESLAHTRVLAFDGYPAITACHGTPGESRGNFLLNPEKKRAVMENLQTQYLLGGHSHNQETDSLYGKVYVNPGSLGLAVDGIGRRAQFALLTAESAVQRKAGQEESGSFKAGDREYGWYWKPQLCSIPYDVESYLQDFTESGLDECGKILTMAVKKVLVSGRNYFYECVVEAERISGLQGAMIPESAWEQASLSLGIMR